MKKVLVAFILRKSKVFREGIYGRIAETRGGGQNPGGAKLSRAPEGRGVLRFRYMTDSFANYGMMAVLVYYFRSKKLAIGMGFREKQ